MKKLRKLNLLLLSKLLANWTSSESLRDVWNKMSQGNYTWNNIRLVTDDDTDYFVVVNAPPTGDTPDPSKTIVFQMEPWMEQHKDQWKEWATPDPSKFFKVCCHKTDYNNNEWHLSKTYNELKTETIVKNNDLDGIVSTVLSAKYSDPGHVKRIDFVKYLENKNSQFTFLVIINGVMWITRVLFLIIKRIMRCFRINMYLTVRTTVLRIIIPKN